MMENFSDRNILILYGSQTGTCQGIAERLVREAKRLHFKASIFPMDEYPIRNLIHENLVSFVCSTTGQGEVPDNMKSFWKFLLRKNLPPNSLDSMQFGVLALGDSSYQKFNFSGKRLQKRLEMLGAKGIVPIGLADDQHELGPDAVVDPWIKSFWISALDTFPLPPGMKPLPCDQLMPPKYRISFDSSESKTVVPLEGGNFFSSTYPFFAPLLKCERVTSSDHFQDTRLVQLDLTNSGIHFDPGDVCMMQPKNLDENVERFVKLFNHLNVDQVFDILPSDSLVKLPPTSVLSHPITLRSCAKTLFDLQAIPGRYFFELLAHFTTDQNEKEKFIEFTTAEGQQDLYEYCNRPRRNILEVLEDFYLNTVPNIPLEFLFDIFPSIKPRAFSIANSLASVHDRVQLLIAVVKYRTKLVKPRLGLCTNWLISLNPGEKVPIWIKKGTFQFPRVGPVVMVGPGTGVAPFRSYITHQISTQGLKDMILYFGCRNPEMDFYFRDEWNHMQETNSNVMVRTAFSRPNKESHGKYVQDVMSEDSEVIFDKIFNCNGHFFIAGRAKQMPEQVRLALKNSLIKCGDLSEDEAERYLSKMEMENRYQTETWS